MEWWHYLTMAIIAISAALIAVYTTHRLSARKEYRRAINCISDEIETDIKLGDLQANR